MRARACSRRLKKMVTPWQRSMVLMRQPTFIEARTIDVTYEVDSGKRAAIGEIRINGLKDVNESALPAAP